MTTTNSNPVLARRSIYELQEAYDSGADKQSLENLVRAWIGIKNLPPSDPRSFYTLAGYHGEPFQLRSDAQYAYWGGYCNHGNVLFPTWHRVYVYQLERALQSIVPGVTMPYWDETSPESLNQGIPAILTQDTFVLDGQTIPNPFKSYVLQVGLVDDMPDEQGQPSYTKPAGYETVRYPLSGLVGTPEAQQASAAHNAKYPYPENVDLLNKNVVAWLNGGNPTPSAPDPTGSGVDTMFQSCLQAPNYTVFSNTTSAGAWNQQNSGIATPLEQPHNDVHLAVGGYDWPGFETGQIAEANGDMGENNTAGFDPIFFFHHCNIDRVFWLWQKQTGHTDAFEIQAGYPGTNSNDGGPTTGIAPNTPLTLDTPLTPFLKNPQDPSSYYTTRDCINIETQLGYTYDAGSLEQRDKIALNLARVQQPAPGASTRRCSEARSCSARSPT